MARAICLAAAERERVWPTIAAKASTRSRYSLPVGDVLEIDDAREAGRDHAVHRLGQLARALDQGVEAGIADRPQLGKLFRGWRCLGGAGDGDLSSATAAS